ncbi:MAG: phosphoenolpyruvate synthase [Nanoarchaeota archaeon]
MQNQKGNAVQDSGFVRWFSELNKNSVDVAGGKGSNLSEIYNLKIPVPPGFVVTAQAYNYFLEKADLKLKIKEILDGINHDDMQHLDEATEKIRKMILDSEIPKDMRKEIIEAYEDLAGDKDTPVYELLRRIPEHIFVAVRSSATSGDSEEASFAGQQDSFLNVKGTENLIEAIKKCFASLFTSRATYYLKKKGFNHEKTNMAVIVQKMVDSDKSGVIFSKDPSYKNDNIIIEAVFGLGVGIVSGRITPDKYVVSREFEIVDRKISNKKIALTRNAGGEEVEIKLTKEKSLSAVLDNMEIKRLAELALHIESHYGKPQDIEFAIEGKNVFIVHNRIITTIGNRIENESVEKVNGEEIFSGLAASPGIASGKVRIVKTFDDFRKIQSGDVIVTKVTNPGMVVVMQKASAIVTDEGGLTSHATIVSREMGIPCVVGTENATSILNDGDLITVDGFSGKIYLGKTEETKKKEVDEVKVETKTKLKIIIDLPHASERASKTGLKSVGLLRIEGIISESGKHVNYFLHHKKFDEYEKLIYSGVHEIAKHFDELWVRTSDVRSDEFQNLEGAPTEKEANPMLGNHGIRYGLKHPELLKSELNALKKISSEGKKIGVMIPQVINVDELKKTKEYLKEIEFNDAKIGIMIETPAAVQLIKDFCMEGIDFVSFGTNDLTQYMLAVDRGNHDVQHLYDEMNPAILYQLEYVMRIARRNGVETSICGQAGSKKEMVKFLVEKGIDSISVNADAAKEIGEYIAELERTDKNIEDGKVELKLIEDPMPVEDLQDDDDNMGKEESEKINEEVNLGL